MERAPAPKDLNTELLDLFAADQKDREEKLYEKAATQFRARDEARMARVREIFKGREGANISPEGLFNLAILFQHGRDADDHMNAWELAKESEAGGHSPAAWLTAAAEDRYLLSSGKKQKWGTQYNRVAGGKFFLMDMLSDEESGVTDEMRRAKGVPTRAEMEEELREMNTEDEK